jgi:NADPH:quinone reductase-like Zn-dependent oxidoreductase
LTALRTPSCPSGGCSLRRQRPELQSEREVRLLQESRKLQLPIDKVFSFDDIGRAFEHMEANRHLGKIVVTL